MRPYPAAPMNNTPDIIRLISYAKTVGPNPNARAVSSQPLLAIIPNEFRAMTSNTTTPINGIIKRHKIFPAQSFKRSIAPVMGRCQEVIPSGVSPGFSFRLSAISSSAISKSAGSTSSAISHTPLIRLPFRREKFFFRKILPYLPKKERNGAKMAPLIIIKFTLRCQRELYPNLHLKFVHQPKMAPLCLQSLFVIARPLQRTHPLQLLPQGVFWLPPYTR